MVVLPAPLGPSNATTAPAATHRSTPARACSRPNRLPRPSALIAGRSATPACPLVMAKEPCMVTSLFTD